MVKKINELIKTIQRTPFEGIAAIAYALSEDWQ
jgi:Txe/YoeB family toxin of Txe-Axe toxin-antitoxin module